MVARHGWSWPKVLLIAICVLLAVLALVGALSYLSNKEPPQESRISLPSIIGESGGGSGSLEWPFQADGDAEARRALASVDDILRRLDLANVAYNSPETMRVGTAAEIELVLSLDTPMDALKSMIEAAGQLEGATIKASNRMEAHLSGPQFDITPVTPEVQAVSREEITKWEWNVMPKAGGRHSLHLVLNALLTVDGEKTPRTVRTFQREIVVEVSWGQRAVAVLDKHGQWLWGAVLIPVLGWAWRLCRSRNKADSEQAS